MTPGWWAARLGLVALGGLVWWRVSVWIGVPTFTAAPLGAAAAILAARRIALQSLE